MNAISATTAALVLIVVAARGLDPKAVALAEGACQTLEQVQNEPFDPTQLAAYDDWFDAPRSEMNSVAAFGGGADYEAALR
jgi:hypothetical protein